jgi:hypothetical protein
LVDGFIYLCRYADNWLKDIIQDRGYARMDGTCQQMMIITYIKKAAN